jgi:hypothetical protein
MNSKRLVIALVLSCLLVLGSSLPVAATPAGAPTAVLFVSGLASGSGSTLGPDGALYVTEGATGRIARVDPQTGAVSTYALGLPPLLPAVGIGGAMDVAFLDGTAYALVTLVGSDLGGTNVVGIYRVDGPTTFTVIADLGAYSLQNPPDTAFFVPTGVQYALDAYRGGFVVTDGHHNRVLWVTLDGVVTELMAFGNIVPTGLEVWGSTIYMAEAGPVPHLPQHGKVVSFGPGAVAATEVASGARLVVDVEFGLGRRLYALSQGLHTSGIEGSPADPNTGSLVAVNADGTFSAPIVQGLNQPTSLEFIGNTAYVVTFGGQIWKIAGVSSPPFGVSP